MSDEPNWLEFYQDRQRSHADAYLAFAQAHAQRDPAAHDQLEAELSNLMTAAGWLRERADWPGLTRLTDALWDDSDFVPDRRLTHQAIPLLEGGLEAARALGDAATIGARLNALGETLAALGQIERAIALHDEALTLAQQANDLAAVRAALCALGIAWGDRDVSKALTYLTQAQDISGVPPDPALEIDLLGAMATAYTQQGQLELATGHLDRALNLAREEEYPYRQADLLYRRGYLRHASGDLAGAHADFQEAANLFRNLSHAFGRGRALQALGGLAIRAGQVEQGIAELEQALQIHRQAGDEGIMPFTLAALGEGYLHLEQPEPAQAHLEQALDMITALKAIPQVAALEAPVRQLLEYVQADRTNRKE
jgi:tetratricopeptide (TPR) repeat protein